MELIDRFARYTEKLSTLNKYASRLGAYAVLHSMHEIEFGNPFLGGLQTVLGSVLLIASTQEATTLDRHEA